MSPSGISSPGTPDIRAAISNLLWLLDIGDYE